MSEFEFKTTPPQDYSLPTLPEGYFWRVGEGNHGDVVVQLRKVTGWFGMSSEVSYREVFRSDVSPEYFRNTTNYMKKRLEDSLASREATKVLLEKINRSKELR